MSARLIRAAAVWAAILPLAAGCVTSRATSPESAPPPAGRLSDKEVIDHVLESSVQLVLERNGDRFRAGSGVVILATADSTGSDCLVLSSGHTFAGVNQGDENETYVLLDRRHGAATKARAEVIARR